MMTANRAMIEGARQVFRLRKLIIFFYILNLVAAAVAVAPAIGLIHRRLAHSLESERLFTNIDPAWIVETLAHFQWWPVAGIGITAALVAILFFLLNTFLAGGALAMFHHEEQPFFSSCARYFWRLFRLMLISLACYAIMLAVNGGMGAALNRLREASMQAGPFAIAGWIRIAVIFFLLATVNMIFDYAKVICIADGHRGAFRATLAAFRFVAGHPGRTLAVYWISMAIGVLFLLAYHGITEAAGQSSVSMVALVFVLRQAYMLARMWLRLWTWSSELHVYAFNSTIVAPEPPSLAVAE
jgi:hypothetical protein